MIRYILNKLQPLLAVKTEVKPYFKVRFRWYNPFNIKEFATNFENNYKICFPPELANESRIEIFRDIRIEIKVKADTLHVFLTAYRAVLFQKEAIPLTDRDRELKKYVLKKYTHVRDTPFI